MSEHAREISELRSGGAPRYKRIPIEIMKINDVKAPSRLQLIIATIRAADRPTRCPPPDPSSALLLQHNRDINPSLIPAAKGRRAESLGLFLRAARLILPEYFIRLHTGCPAVTGY
jgi:hypothetical protein